MKRTFETLVEVLNCDAILYQHCSWPEYIKSLLSILSPIIRLFSILKWSHWCIEILKILVNSVLELHSFSKSGADLLDQFTKAYRRASIHFLLLCKILESNEAIVYHDLQELVHALFLGFTLLPNETVSLSLWDTGFTTLSLQSTGLRHSWSRVSKFSQKSVYEIISNLALGIYKDGKVICK